VPVPRDGTRVLVVDDHPVVRRGIVALLESLPWTAPPVEAASLADARRLATTERPALAVVDVGLPDGDGIALVAELAVISPGCRALVLTMDSSAETAQRALAAGAAGYLAKDADPQLVVDALTTIASGGLVLGFDLAAGALRLAGSPTGGSDGPFDVLTPRELDVVRGVAEGLGNPQIARRLGISEKTVRNVLSGVLPKVGVGDRVRLALLAHEHHLRG
jgi:DNA-binding NarL/FixJ family response regulator